MLLRFMNGSILLRSASTLTASTTKLRSLYLSYMRWTMGSSSLHGPHQVAQTFTRMTLPFNWERRIDPPSAPAISRSGKSGGGFSARAGAPAEASRTRPNRKGSIIGRKRTSEIEYSAIHPLRSRVCPLSAVSRGTWNLGGHLASMIEGLRSKPDTAWLTRTCRTSSRPWRRRASSSESAARSRRSWRSPRSPTALSKGRVPPCFLKTSRARRCRWPSIFSRPVGACSRRSRSLPTRSERETRILPGSKAPRGADREAEGDPQGHRADRGLSENGPVGALPGGRRDGRLGGSGQPAGPDLLAPGRRAVHHDAARRHARPGFRQDERRRLPHAGLRPQNDGHALAKAQGWRRPGQGLRETGAQNGSCRGDRLLSRHGLLRSRPSSTGPLGVSLRRVPARRSSASDCRQDRGSPGSGRCRDRARGIR